MDKDFLIRLITTSQRVVLPGFGAFLKKSEAGHPIFTPFLKGDDGFLSAEIQKEYHVDSNDSKEIIVAFVEHIKEVLSQKQRYVIEGIGVLIVNDNGAITLVMDTSKQIAAPTTNQNVTSEATPSVQNPVAAQPLTNNRNSFATQLPKAQAAPQSIARAQSTVAPKPVQQGGFVRPTHPHAPQVTPKPSGIQQRVAQPHIQPNAQPNAQPTPQPQPEREPARGGDRRQEAAASGTRVIRKTKPTHARSGHNQINSNKKQKKGDLWLIIAIVAASLVIILMAYGLFTAQEVSMLE